MLINDYFLSQKMYERVQKMTYSTRREMKTTSRCSENKREWMFIFVFLLTSLINCQRSLNFPKQYFSKFTIEVPQWKESGYDEVVWRISFLFHRCLLSNFLQIHSLYFFCWLFLGRASKCLFRWCEWPRESRILERHWYFTCDYNLHRNYRRLLHLPSIRQSIFLWLNYSILFHAPKSRSNLTRDHKVSYLIRICYVKRLSKYKQKQNPLMGLLSAFTFIAFVCDHT